MYALYTANRQKSLELGSSLLEMQQKCVKCQEMYRDNIHYFNALVLANKHTIRAV